MSGRAEPGPGPSLDDLAISRKLSVSRKLVLARRRLTGGQSARTLARKTKLNHSYVSKLLRGTRRPSLDACWTLSQELGVTLDEFRARLRALWKLIGEPGPQRVYPPGGSRSRGRSRRSPKAARRR